MASSVPTLGVKDGQLLPLPDSPNGVSSRADRDAQHLPPFALRGSASESLGRIQTICEEMGAKVIERTDEYLRTEFRTRIMRFTDDVEWLLVDDELHFRSKSRLGYWDMGVNRRRIERIRELYLGDSS